MKISEFQKLNAQRCARWHAIDSWSPGEWMTAVMGELGEAANIIKKLNRIRDGVVGNKSEDQHTGALLEQLKEELADTYTYLDLIFTYYGWDTEEAVKSKFNKISERNGFPERA